MSGAGFNSGYVWIHSFLEIPSGVHHHYTHFIDGRLRPREVKGTVRGPKANEAEKCADYPLGLSPWYFLAPHTIPLSAQLH